MRARRCFISLAGNSQNKTDKRTLPGHETKSLLLRDGLQGFFPQDPTVAQAGRQEPTRPKLTVDHSAQSVLRVCNMHATKRPPFRDEVCLKCVFQLGSTLLKRCASLSKCATQLRSLQLDQVSSTVRSNIKEGAVVAALVLGTFDVLAFSCSVATFQAIKAPT